MATSVEKETKIEANDQIVSVELSAPLGWKKKIMPKKGGTPKKNEIVFIAPTGEEFNNKRQLEKYLKSHSDSPPVSEFVWSTGGTPRRSSRISEKVKTTPPPEIEPPKKRSKNSPSSKKDEKETEVTPEEAEVKNEVHLEDTEQTQKDEEAEEELTIVKDVEMQEVVVEVTKEDPAEKETDISLVTRNEKDIEEVDKEVPLKLDDPRAMEELETNPNHKEQEKTETVLADETKPEMDVREKGKAIVEEGIDKKQNSSQDEVTGIKMVEKVTENGTMDGETGEPKPIEVSQSGCVDGLQPRAPSPLSW